jgi:redox-sensing transcriptional repressor
MRILEDSDSDHLTSAQLEGLSGWPSHTIRKDISFLALHGSNGDGEEASGKAGSQGGYSPAVLAPLIRKALSLDRRRKCCILGLGRLGSAYLGMGGMGPEAGFRSAMGFELVAGFDISVNRVEILRSPVPLYPAYKMGEVIGRFGIEIALLCVPPEAAQSAAEKLIAAGIRGILNFVPLALTLPPAIAVRNVYLENELCALAIRMQAPVPNPD